MPSISGLFPLGSVHDEAQPAPQRKGGAVARLSDVHPLQPQETVQGALAVIHELADWLIG
jgi:glycine dehydrogenase subunit 2